MEGREEGGGGRSAVNVAWAAWYRVKYDATSPNIFLRLRIVDPGHATLVDFVLTWYFIIYAHDMEILSWALIAFKVPDIWLIDK